MIRERLAAAIEATKRIDERLRKAARVTTMTSEEYHDLMALWSFYSRVDNSLSARTWRTIREPPTAAEVAAAHERSRERARAAIDRIEKALRARKRASVIDVAAVRALIVAT